MVAVGQEPKLANIFPNAKLLIIKPRKHLFLNKKYSTVLTIITKITIYIINKEIIHKLLFPPNEIYKSIGRVIFMPKPLE